MKVKDGKGDEYDAICKKPFSDCTMHQNNKGIRNKHTPDIFPRLSSHGSRLFPSHTGSPSEQYNPPVSGNGFSYLSHPL